MVNILKRHLIKRGCFFRHIYAKINDVHIARAAGQVGRVDPWFHDVGVWPPIWVYGCINHPSSGHWIDIKWADAGSTHKAEAFVFFEAEGGSGVGAGGEVGVDEGNGLAVEEEGHRAGFQPLMIFWAVYLGRCPRLV